MLKDAAHQPYVYQSDSYFYGNLRRAVIGVVLVWGVLLLINLVL